MRIGLTIAAMAGIALGLALVFYFGFDDVAQAILAAGVVGFLTVTSIRLVTVGLCGWAWHVLTVDGSGRHTLHLFIWARWVRDSVSNLLGLVPGAGEAAGIRALTLHRIPSRVAIATTIVDTTTELMSQLAFTFLGLGIIAVSGMALPSAGHAVIALIVATVALAVFVVAQKRGLFRLIETLPARLGLTTAHTDPASIGGVDADIQAIYARRNRVTASASLHLAAWIIGTAEAWIALRLMGHPIGMGDAIALESLVFALRAAAFFVPSALGVQEGGYIAIGALFGLTPEVALAFSLLKRGCEIATGIPAILAWQIFEGQSLLQTTVGAPKSEEAL